MKSKVIFNALLLLIIMAFSFGCTQLMEGLVPPNISEQESSQDKGISPDGLVKVLIGFKDKPGQAEQALVQGVGGKIKYTYTLIPAIAASIPEAAIDALKRNPKISNVDLDIKVYAVDAELDNTWGVKRIGAGEVHSIYTGNGINVAVIDSGIDYTHSELNDNYVGGYDFANNDIDPMDDNGHGTHVAGTIAAEDNGEGVVGVAPNANLYALKVLGADGSGDYSDVIAALQWCVDQGIQITNNSYGSSSDPGTAVQQAFDIAYAAGILHVAAAGNGGNPPGRGDNVIYPAKYTPVIAVAASDSNDKRANFSSTGPDVDLIAPGVNIKSTLPGESYDNYSGTSMASPHVAGAAAVVWGAISGSNETVKSKLLMTAEDLGLPSDHQGNGLVRVDKAVGAQSINQAPIVSIAAPVNGSTFASGEGITFNGSASDNEDGELTSGLAWTSSIDNTIGSGGSFSQVLSDGIHTITAIVTDSGGKSASDSISITVGTPVIDSIMYVSTVDMWYRSAGPNRFVSTKVKVVSESGVVSGATVYLTTRLPDGSSLTNSGSTTTDGTITFEIKSQQKGEYISTVYDVSKEGLVYDKTIGMTSGSITVQ